MSEKKPLEIYQGNTSPSITDTIRVNDAAHDLSGQTVAFRMRPLSADTLKVDAAAVVLNQTTNKGGVRYDWSAADTDTPGQYVAWWHVTIAPGVTQDTPEFRLDVVAHAPGEEVRIGPIAERIGDYIPATYHAMKESTRFGDISIQRHVDLVKSGLFATVVPASAEATFYGIRTQDYAARVATIRLIPAAVDYWQDHSLTITTRGPDETQTFVDRRDGLWKIYERLRASVRAQRLLLEDGVWVIASRQTTDSPAVSHGSGTKVTLDPADFESIDAASGSIYIPWTLLPYSR